MAEGEKSSFQTHGSCIFCSTTLQIERKHKNAQNTLARNSCSGANLKSSTGLEGQGGRRGRVSLWSLDWLRIYCVTWATLEITAILLPQPPEVWEYRHESLHQEQVNDFSETTDGLRHGTAISPCVLLYRHSSVAEYLVNCGSSAV